MIDRKEIEEKAAAFDILHPNVERDYVFGWLLKSIYENEYLRARLVFKGGNSLRKAFYANTRFSADLDFSVEGPVEQERMAAEINEACREVQRRCAVQFIIERNTFEAGPQIDKERKSYKGRIYFNDFFGNQDELVISIKTDVTEFDRLILPAVSKPLIHPYSDSGDCTAELKCMALEEVVANKMKCLIQRRHSHDLFDLVYSTFIDRSIELDRALVLDTFLRKTIFRANPGVAKDILLGIPLTFFGGVWEKYIRCPKATRFTFDKAVEGFRDTVERLFSGVSTGQWGEQLFYGPEHRNLIMDAGRERKLMRLTYHGAERLIEPYSLAYKRAAGKQAREYFYAYDTTGGNSGPGIKTFFNTDIVKLEITGQTFEPRYEIELSKAGEQIRKGYFGQSFRSSPRLAPRTKKGRAGSGFGSWGSQQTYKVQCPYCQKIFTRMTRSNKLKEHKSPDGYRCAGRTGYQVF